MYQFIVRVISCFILNQQKRKAFRQKWFGRLKVERRFDALENRLGALECRSEAQNTLNINLCMVLANGQSGNKIYGGGGGFYVGGKELLQQFIVKNNGEKYFDFNGAKMPDVADDGLLRYVFDDTFLVSCFFHDDYAKNIAKMLDLVLAEGVYGYRDGDFDVTVKTGDVVIDAGAWVGDFSAYAVSKGATAYAFEPTTATYNLLQQTVALNDHKIYPVPLGLSDAEKEITLYRHNGNSGANTIIRHSWTNDPLTITETIKITTLDKFVAENKIAKIDFIKADIEGAERDMLRGATGVLQKFAPKLAICTYHLPDDPQVLEKIITDANPRYRVVQMRHKLFAAAVG
ncbi:hypothetical protein AGMMS49959_14320 [Planctomycetales bacterium]|nr:hypothetical protein AGMMS49959_14320 [Planctomycetales bacterium]